MNWGLIHTAGPLSGREGGLASTIRQSTTACVKRISMNVNRLCIFVFLILLTGFTVPPHLLARQETTQPGDVALYLSLKNNQTVFREGEIIALTAEYTADAKNKYILNNRSYDRSGRLDGMEEFCIEPNSGVDPLSDYFNRMNAFMGGGLYSEQDLGEEPFLVELEINEWQSLPPGTYHLSIVGNRVSLQRKDAQLGTDGTPVPLRSNTVEFQVERAEPEWQSDQLASAVRALDSPGSTTEEKKHAAHVLRFLGSEAATRELARRYWSGGQTYGWDMKFGLYGSRYRTIAIQEMKDAIKNPQHPVTTEFVDTLVTLEMQSDPKYRLPTYDTKNKETWEKARDAYSAEFARRTGEYMEEAADVAQTKSREAQAVSASELLQSGLPLTPEARTRWRQMLLASLDSLPVQQQNDLIEDRWEEVGGPEWLPVLKGIVANNSNSERTWGKPRETALRRIWEISPGQGRQLILQEIAAPKGDIDIGVLGLLPERELPQIEAPTIARIKSGSSYDIEFSLIDRYASARALGQMKPIYEAHRGNWACVPQTAMLRYFLRVSPDYGVKEVSDSLSERKATGCFRTQLSELKEYVRLPQLEQVAIAKLDDTSPEVARDAAQALQRFGSPKAEDALWARLERFHRKWKDQPDELLHPHPGTIEYDQESGLEEALVKGIAEGQAWFADAETIRRLKPLSSPEMQAELNRISESLQSGEFEGILSWWPDDKLNFAIGWYHGMGIVAFKEKLAQFPPASRFSIATTESDAHQIELAELADAAAANGQVLYIHK